MYLFFKRLTDILIALTALLLLAPLLLLVILLLCITGEREVFYRQRRIGQHGQPFHIWKFATMLRNSPNMGNGEITLRQDPRVTPVGRILRRSKINELPQIWNVIIGDMSIVGPRPLMEVSFRLYTPEQQQLIYKARPGITGIGSVVFRDEEQLLSAATDPRVMYERIYPYKATLEIWYRDRAGWFSDMKIILLTAIGLFSSSRRWVNLLFSGLPSRPDFEQDCR